MTLFSREWGRLSVLIKGARSRKKNPTAAFEPFALSEFLIYIRKKRELQHFHSCSLINYFPSIRKDGLRLSAAGAAMELIYKTVPAGTPLPGLFDLTVAYLKRLEEAEHQPPTYSEKLILMYLLHFLKLMGFSPALLSCVRCGIQDDAISGFLFSPAAGGRLCPHCAHEAPERQRYPKEVLQGLLILQKSHINDIADQPLAYGKVIRNLLTDFLSHCFERNLKLNCLDFYYTIYA